MAPVLNLKRIDLMDGMLMRVNEVRQITSPTIYRPATTSNHPYAGQYSPRHVFLGLYNPDIDVDMESTSATIDISKVQVKMDMASAFKETVNKSWMDICQLVVVDPEDMKRMYDDCPIDDVDAVRNILTLDAVFVTCILHTLWDVHKSEDRSVRPRFAEIARVVQDRGLSKGNTGIFLDILAIFQNQIPFQLIKKVIEMMYQTPLVNAGGVDGPNSGGSSPEPYHSDEGISIVLNVQDASPISNGHSNPGDEHSQADLVLNAMVEMACGLMMYNLPGPKDKALQRPPLETSDYSHLLDCVYRGALHDSRDIRFEWPEDGDDTHPIATATQLKRAGINIIGGSENISDIRFERGIVGATLILPPLRITSWTEPVLRNLVAYESRVLKKGELMCYLSFMDQLIDTAQDVLLLKEKTRSVIEKSELSSDADVANIFNTLLDNSNDVPLPRKWARLRKDIHMFYKSETRQLWFEFSETHFSRPWITGSVVAAIALLVLTFLQTLYTMKSYYEGGSATSDSTNSG